MGDFLKLNKAFYSRLKMQKLQVVCRTAPKIAFSSQYQTCCGVISNFKYCSREVFKPVLLRKMATLHLSRFVLTISQSHTHNKRSKTPDRKLSQREQKTCKAGTHPHARLRIFQPHRSCTALGYMVDSLEVLVTPQKNSPPVNTTLIR